MKKFLALVAALILTVVALPSLADGGHSDDTGEVISMRASLRTAPQTSAERLSWVNNGESFYILDENEEWYYVEFTASNGNVYTGWILQCYVVKNPVHLVAQSSGNLYASPSLTNKRVGTFGRFEKFTVIEETSRYYLVSCRNAAAFISRNVGFWTDKDLEFAENVIGVGVLKEKANLYMEPNTKSKIDSFKAGTPFDILGYDGDYTIVKYQGVYGYVLTDSFE